MQSVDDGKKLTGYVYMHIVILFRCVLCRPTSLGCWSRCGREDGRRRKRLPKQEMIVNVQRALGKVWGVWGAGHISSVVMWPSMVWICGHSTDKKNHYGRACEKLEEPFSGYGPNCHRKGFFGESVPTDAADGVCCWECHRIDSVSVG
jgi:hypothetical protein